MRKTVETKLKLQVTRRGIQIPLGMLWLLDGLLQLQPHMFSADFANDVLAPAAQGQPGFIAGPMHFFMGMFMWQPALINTGIVAVQIGLGVLILWKRTARLGLWASVAWGLFVWYIGEGLSGLASWHAMMLMGSPGAAIVYVLLALGTLSFRKASRGKDHQRPAYWLVLAWIAIWGAGAFYQVLPGQNTIADNTSMISGNAQGAPTWLASVDHSVAHWLSGLGTATMAPDSMAGMPGMAGMSMPAPLAKTSGPHQVSGFWFLLLVALLQLLIAFGVLIPGFARVFAVSLGSLLSVFYWVVGQSLGTYFSGVATDPNTGPLLVLLGIAVLGCTQRDAVVRAYFARIKNGFISEMRALNEG